MRGSSEGLWMVKESSFLKQLYWEQNGQQISVVGFCTGPLIRKGSWRQTSDPWDFFHQVGGFERSQFYTVANIYKYYFSTIINVKKHTVLIPMHTNILAYKLSLWARAFGLFCFFSVALGIFP